ncbi:MAG: MMPL family transporter [Opitutaceae bacterium]|nr:MMPL family transporter [Opitutaceae bacterium]
MDNAASRPKWIARLALLALAAACGGWLLRLDHAAKISTNVLDLMPAAEQSLELGIVRGFSQGAQARVVLIALRDPRAPETPPATAAQAFAAALRASPLFAEAVAVGDPAADGELGKKIFEHRFDWLLPTWLAERERAFAATGAQPAEFPRWLAAQAAADLEAFLARPEAAAMQDILPRDPLLLVPSLAEKARLLATPAAHAGGHALIWALSRPSPLAEEGQAPIFAVIERALAEARAAHPGVELRWTGIARFAAASRARIESEIGLLNLGSLLAVLGVSSLLVRRIWRLLHLVPIILLSLAGAWTISTLIFDRLHILVFVIGSLLSGVAIDYGFYLYMQPSLRPDEPYGEKLRRLLKPLLASCLTTVIGFSLLLFSDLPLIRQIGVFVSAGLLCALGAAMLYFAQLDRPQLEGRTIGNFAGHGSRWRPAVRLLAIAAIAVAVLGPLRLTWRDDVRELDLPSPELHANDAALRALFGDSAKRSLWLTHGATLAEARTRLEAFLASRSGLAAGSVGQLLPTEADWTAWLARRATLGAFAPEFRAALAARGFTPESFEPFFTGWHDAITRPAAGTYEKLATDLRASLTGPLSLLSHTSAAPFWFLTVVEQPAAEAAPAPHTLALNQLASLNDLFTRYRWSALRLSLVGLGFVMASVFLIYPPRRGLRIAVVPAGACFFVFGALGLAGQTLNLFHLLGAFLGVCLSHNYAIFSSDHATSGKPPPAAVRLSALSTAASFGVLACSRIPVIHALGLTVALIVVTTLLVVELEPLARRTDA